MAFTVPPIEATPDLLIRGVSQINTRDFAVRLMRLRFNLATTGAPVYGPFDVPLLNDMAIVAAYAHPVSVVLRDPSSASPSAGEPTVLRPYFSIRGPQRMAMLCTEQFNAMAAVGPLSTPATIPAPIEAPAQRWGLPGDARHDLGNQAEGYGAGTFDLQRGYRVTYVNNEGPDPADPSARTIYKVVLNIGQTINVSVANVSTPPSVGEPWPLDQEDTREIYEVGAIQRSLEATYPRQDGFAVPDTGDDLDPAQRFEHDDPYVISAVKLIQDLPSNPSGMVQLVQLNNGQTLKVPLSTTAVVGEKLGDPTTTRDPQAVIDVSEWAEIMVFMVLAKFPNIATGTLAGLQPDVWPISVAGTPVTP